MNTNGLPISKLHYDILWQIFMTNVCPDIEVAIDDVPLYHALNVARYTSQVCHQWREILLGSPTIWADLIDLDLLQKSDHWRNEVVKRTANSPLRIQGNLWFPEINSQDPSLLFIFDLLNDHWARIRRLDISITGVLLFPDSQDPQKWKALQRPSPLLEFLRISFAGYSKDIQNYDAFFSANAPVLTQLHCPCMKFNIRAPWVPQLHAITLSDNIVSISELFSLLNNLPILESLEIQRDFRIADLECTGTDNVLKSNMHHPQLKRIKLGTQLRVCQTILEHVNPSPGCVLYLKTDEPDTNQEVVDFQPLLTRYSEWFFNEEPTWVTSLSLHSDDFQFSMSSSKASPSPIFKFEIDSFKISYNTIPQFLTSFSSCEFSHITYFRFYVLLEPEVLLPVLSKFLMVLDSVEIMEVTQSAVRILLNFAEQPGFFPSLRTLTLDQISGPELRHTYTGYKEILLSFLKLRRTAGCPIETLDLTHFPFVQLDNLQFLEEITGLKVKWTKYSDYMTEEYTCGSGIPATLDLRVNVNEIKDLERIYRVPLLKRWDVYL